MACALRRWGGPSDDREPTPGRPDSRRGVSGRAPTDQRAWAASRGLRAGRDPRKSAREGRERWRIPPRHGPRRALMSDEAAAGPKLTTTGIIYLLVVLVALVLAFTGARDDTGVHILKGTLGEDGQPFAFVLFVLILLGVAF